MHWTYTAIKAHFKEPAARALLKKSNHGLERECLRVNGKGYLSQEPHPKAFGAKLLHPYISTDFCESQLEFITPHFDTAAKALDSLKEIHSFAFTNLDGEYLWPFSTPCPLPPDRQIPLANFGTTAKGKEKTLYRQGLSHRYGRHMQTLSGIHYNFSFADELFTHLKDRFKIKMSHQELINSSYLHLCRNFFRWGWLNTYLFGASPAAHKSYVKTTAQGLKTFDAHSIHASFGTSIRMSNWGYYSKVQAQVAVSYNSLQEYTRDLRRGLTTPCPRWEKIGLFVKKQRRQMNVNYLQQEAELYSRIRLKPKLVDGLRPVDALEKNGVHYVEVRTVDLNPFIAEGVELEQLHFLNLFLIYCLFKESPELTSKEQQVITENQNKVALHGRDPKLKLRCCRTKPRSLTSLAKDILLELKELAELLDADGETRFVPAWQRAWARLGDHKKLPSFRIIQQMRQGKKPFHKLAFELAQEHKTSYASYQLPLAKEKEFSDLAKDSLVTLEKMEIAEDFEFAGYGDMELSTQLVIREAIERGVQVDILDRKDNFIRLSSGRKIEYVKQATKTSRDSLISYCLMENKEVTKKVLHDAGIAVPQGRLYSSKEVARSDYEFFQNRKVVVKPNFSNYGDGIGFADPFSQAEFSLALDHAFSFNDEVVVENFIEGKEYRFLVINGALVAICHRMPANVVGDGKKTIAALVAAKNEDPRSYKWRDYKIRLEEEELKNLAIQHLSPDSVLKKGQQVFLRKNSNVSMGGDPIDMTGKVHLEYEKIAVKAASVAGACFCGLDMIIADIKAKPTAENHAIIELNFNPALILHRFPYQGEKRYIEKIVLDLLGF